MPRATKEQLRRKRASRKASEDISEIGPAPLTSAQRRKGTLLRKQCWNDLEKFNVKVFPNSTGLKPFGSVQVDSIKHDMSIVDNGGRICRAEPRGFGKTTRGCNAALWAILTGRRLMVPVFSASLEKSKSQIMARWKSEIMTNDELFWMFPELIWPLRALENKPQRCASQTYNGELTHTQWTADRIVFPHIPGVPGSGSILVALPLKSCRGATHTRPDNTVLRPDLCIFDDVQKDEDADNYVTIAKIEDLIDHTAMMLGGHSVSMSAIMNCTVRREDDLSERYLKKQGWRRVRYKMLESPSVHQEDHWFGRYATIRQSYDPESPDDQERAEQESLQYYKKHRKEMDEGAKVTWKWAYTWADKNPREISAIQHAYNIMIDLGESVFSSECQNQPLRESSDLEMLSVMEICQKQVNTKRGVVPIDVEKVVCHIDVHNEILDFEVWGFAQGFSGYKIAGGTYPDQGRNVFVHAKPPVPLSSIHQGLDDSARIHQALNSLFDILLDREWLKEDGEPMHITKCLVDANGLHSEAIRKACRQSKYAAVITPAFGRGVTARQMPISRWEPNLGKSWGPEWCPTTAKRYELGGVIFDANYWKTRFHKGLSMRAGERGCLMLHHADPDDHVRAAHAYLAEKPHEVACGTRIVYEWQLRPGRENHPLDCAVGCMVAASMAGITTVREERTKKRISLKKLQESKR